MTPNLLVIVARAPISGAVKTRLASTIGDAAACDLFEAFLIDLARRFTPGPDFDVAWAFTPAEWPFQSALEKLAGTDCLTDVKFIPQDGETLNDRLTNLFKSGFERGYRRIANMASDSPQLQREIATEAFDRLVDHDVAIGRVADGGYYLIGLSRFSDLLIDLPMSTTNAAESVLERARHLGMTISEITPSFDVDEESDLIQLREELSPSGAAAPETWVALERLGLDRTVSISSRELESSTSMAAWESSPLL